MSNGGPLPIHSNRHMKVVVRDGNRVKVADSMNTSNSKSTMMRKLPRMVVKWLRDKVGENAEWINLQSAHQMTNSTACGIYTLQNCEYLYRHGIVENLPDVIGDAGGHDNVLFLRILLRSFAERIINANPNEHRLKMYFDSVPPFMCKDYTLRDPPTDYRRMYAILADRLVLEIVDGSKVLVSDHAFASRLRKTAGSRFHVSKLKDHNRHKAYRVVVECVDGWNGEIQKDRFLQHNVKGLYFLIIFGCPAFPLERGTMHYLYGMSESETGEVEMVKGQVWASLFEVYGEPPPAMRGAR